MKLDGCYLCFDETEVAKIKKITGHSFVALIGLDPFVKKGDALIMMMGLIKEKIDPFYTNRGELAEKIVQKVYLRDFAIEVHNKKEIGYDNFKDNKTFGGLYDLRLPARATTIEVKSKSMKDLLNIQANGSNLHEKMQGEYYAYLNQDKSLIMEYIFFDGESEEEIREGKKLTTLMNLKRYSEETIIDREFMSVHLENARNIYETFKEEKKIHITDISEKILNHFGYNSQEIMLGELPF